MAWKKGQSGNPSGGPKDKAFADAIRLIVNEDDPVRGKRKLRCLAERLYDDAMAGEGWAMAQIADRLDGKPAQESTVTLRNELDAFNELELRELVRRELEASGRSSITPSEYTDKTITHRLVSVLRVRASTPPSTADRQA